MEENPNLLDEVNSKFLKIDEEIYNKLKGGIQKGVLY
jgi:hypothetical protein